MDYSTKPQGQAHDVDDVVHTPFQCFYEGHVFLYKSQISGQIGIKTNKRSGWKNDNLSPPVLYGTIVSAATIQAALDDSVWT